MDLKVSWRTDLYVTYFGSDVFDPTSEELW
jgi:hypothetical protein